MIRGGNGTTRRPGWLPARLRSGRGGSLRRVLARSSCEALPGFRIVRLRGEPEACGLQHGVLLRTLRRGAEGGAGRWQPPRWGRRHRLPVPRSLERERSGLLRVAAGAREPWGPDLETASAGRGWRDRTGFGLVAATPGDAGELLHLCLLELPRDGDLEPMLFVRDPDSGLAHVGLGVAGGLGLLAGMNEAGLSASWLPVRSPPPGAPTARRRSLPLSLAVRLVLERARSLPEAASFVARTLPRPAGDRLLIASAGTGQAVLLELSGAEPRVEPMRGGTLVVGGCPGPGVEGPGDGSASGGPEASLERLLARSPVPPEPEGLVELVRDPWPREGRGLLLTTPEPDRHPGTPRAAVALLLEPARGRLRIAADPTGGVHGPWLAFDLARGGIRRPAGDRPGSAMMPCGRAVEALLRGEPTRAAEALREARAREPDHAVVLLLAGLAGAPEALRRLVALRPDSPHARLARAWLGEADAATAIRIPVPSVCAPRAWLHPAGRRIRPDPG